MTSALSSVSFLLFLAAIVCKTLCCDAFKIVSPKANQDQITDLLFVSVQLDENEHENEKESESKLGKDSGNALCLSMSKVGRENVDANKICFSDFPTKQWKKKNAFSTVLKSTNLEPGVYQLKATLVDKDESVLETAESVFTILQCDRHHSKNNAEGRKIIDVFTFFDELDVLELRFAELYDVVDIFVGIESDTTHAGHRKTPCLKKAFEPGGKLHKYKDKVVVELVKDEEITDPRWRNDGPHGREMFQRDFILTSKIFNAVDPTDDSTLFIIADVDEIPRKSIVEKLKFCQGFRFPVALHLSWFHYAFNYRAPLQKWGMGDSYREGPIITTKLMLLENKPSTFRRCMINGALMELSILDNAGWHLSRFGKVDSVVKKLRASANIDAHKDLSLDSNLISELREKGIAILPPGGNSLDGATLFQAVDKEEVIQDIPGGPKFSIWNNPSFKHMFLGKRAMIGRDAFATWNLLEATVKSNIKEDKTIELFVNSGMPERNIPIQTVSITCRNDRVPFVRELKQDFCNKLYLQHRLCNLFVEQIIAKCDTVEKQENRGISLKLQVDRQASFRFYASAKDSSSTPKVQEIYFKTDDNVPEIAFNKCQELAMPTSSCAPFTEHILNLWSKLQFMFQSELQLGDDVRSNFRRLEMNLTMIGNDPSNPQVVQTDFGCLEEPSDVAWLLCNDDALVDKAPCMRMLSTKVSQEQSKYCSAVLEDWLDRPIRDYLRFLQWRILEESLYYNVKTWKFPFDLWMYQEIMVSNPPDVLIEVGNMYGGSALYFARLFDTIGHHCRIIAVDIDHSNLDVPPKAHPRITWIEGDALEAVHQVKSLIHPDETVMLVEDASHTYEHTLQIMRLYSDLVTPGSWMIIEDTVLHNGAENPTFNDPGAFASVTSFLEEQPQGKWRLAREMERFVITWNPRGFLQRTNKFTGSDDPQSCSISDHHDNHNDDEKEVDDDQILNRRKHIEDLSKVLDVTVQVSPDRNLVMDLGNRKVPVSDILGMKEPLSGEKSISSLASIVEAAALGVCQSDPECVTRLVARSLGEFPVIRDLPIPVTEREVDTSLHVNKKGENEGVETLLTYGRGVAVLQGIDENAAKSIRNLIVQDPRFDQLEKEVSSSQSRYLNALCANAEEGCKPLSTELLEILALDDIQDPIRKLFGDDYLLDSTSLSIQWPGSGSFGPHVDRPFLTHPKKDNWPYSSANMTLPPKQYPLSIQAIVLLDNFTCTNGAFYYLSNTTKADEQDLKSAADDTNWKHWFNRYGGKIVTGRAGNIIIAHGATWHGALGNYSPRPRIALLAQFVPRFIRPSQTFPSSILENVKDESKKQFLRSILDVEKKVEQVTVNNAENHPIAQFKVDVNNPQSVGASAARFAQLVTNSTALGPQIAREAIRIALHNKDLCQAPVLDDRKDTETNMVLDGSLKRSRRLAFGFGGSMGTLPKDQVVELVKNLLKFGFRALDLAEIYANQDLIGEAFAEIWDVDGKSRLPDLPDRSEVHITSKIWSTNLAPEHVHATLDATLKTLNLSYLDSWLIHWPVPLGFVGIHAPSKGLTMPKDEQGSFVYAKGFGIVDTWRAMEEIVLTTNKVLSIGLSNAPSTMVHDLIISARTRMVPAVNQVELHPFLPQLNLIRICDSHRVAIQGYSPLASGNAELLEHPDLVELGKTNGMTVAELLVHWSLAKAPAGAVYSSRDLSRAIFMLKSVNEKQIASEIVHAIDQLIEHKLKSRRRIYSPPAFSLLFD